MTCPTRKIVVLGSTGSIGRSTLDVAAASGGYLRIIGLSAHRNCELLLVQAQQHRPRWIVVTDAEAAAAFDWSGLPAESIPGIKERGPGVASGPAGVRLQGTELRVICQTEAATPPYRHHPSYHHPSPIRTHHARSSRATVLPS